eukprot:scaffold148651_cov31-Tisochrysis_lutea.AAC.12
MAASFSKFRSEAPERPVVRAAISAKLTSGPRGLSRAWTCGGASMPMVSSPEMLIALAAHFLSL